MNKPHKLSTRSLELYFGKRHTLKNVSIDIPEKEIVALIGPSGCGKTTFLRTFNRMHDLVHDIRITGEVRLEDQDIYNKNTPVTTIRRRIGMVFQKPNPFPKSVFDNVAYGLKLNKTPGSEIPEIVENALKESALWEEVKNELKKPANRLSGGQQQRLCIARTIAVKPEVILMDEPCSALDPISTLKVEELMQELKKNYTIVVVTHNMQQAQRVADKVAFMYMGELMEFGSKEQIFNNPQQQMTRNYISGHFG